MQLMRPSVYRISCSMSAWDLRLTETGASVPFQHTYENAAWNDVKAPRPKALGWWWGHRVRSSLGRKKIKGVEVK